MKYASLIIVLLLAPLASAETSLWNGDAWIPMQCGGGGCCQGWGCPQGGCPNGGCQGGICYPQQRPQPQQPQDQYEDEPSGPAPRYELRPPAPSAVNPPLPAPPPVQTPPMPAPQPVPTVDPQAKAEQDRLIKETHDSFERIEKSLVVIRDKGGCQCDNSKLEAKLDQVIKAISEIKIPATPQTPAQPATEEHVVVVADHNAPYWPKLSEAIGKTNQTYHGVQEISPPEFPIGIHPQAVVYRNNVPVRIVKGYYEVEDLLARLSRGDSI